MLGVRIYYRVKSVRGRGRVSHHEGGLNAAFRGVFGFGYIGGVIAYLIYPEWLGNFTIPLPAWVRWAGLALSIISLSLLWWVHSALNVHFDTTLHIQEHHQIVTTGPYRWVRHPMYTALFFLGLGYLLTSANWAIGISYLTGLLIVLVFRVPKEEALLIETFGEEYHRYIQETGKYFPKITSTKIRNIQKRKI
jgi:protein-S-isoprenylcysteine O-methyltransferase Ste14